MQDSTDTVVSRSVLNARDLRLVETRIVLILQPSIHACMDSTDLTIPRSV